MEFNSFLLSEYQKEELKFVYELFSPKDGKISLDSAKSMLLRLEEASERHQYMLRPTPTLAKSEPNSPDCLQGMEITPFITISNISCFPNGTNQCTFEEFASMYESLMSAANFDDMLMRAFGLLDIKKTGIFDSKDLQKVAEILGESIQSDEESKRLLNMINPENKSGISFQEFKEFFISDIKNDEH